MQQKSNKFKVRNGFNKLRSRKAELICLIRNWPKWYTDGIDLSLFGFGKRWSKFKNRISVSQIAFLYSEKENWVFELNWCWIPKLLFSISNLSQLRQFIPKLTFCISNLSLSISFHISFFLNFDIAVSHFKSGFCSLKLPYSLFVTDI